ncbi:hypothetical protein DNI29_23210 [Hymenobacter sediminis]|uniref:hypothetical protein n=1 Tax=Hymenobacter sediminis TaxID=2218621 RepID=UPI000DA6C5C8|nr:hypothetical protein [Hymenobacter sediminis]RPD43771.1 hypothetical protein DNI29_23210 [Hymenobacter sediminis]
MSRALTVFLKPNVLQHPDYIKFNSGDLWNRPHTGPADIGWVAVRKDEFKAYVTAPNILPFIRAQGDYIKEIDWEVLKEPSEKGEWPEESVADIMPFDNDSFWTFATNRIQNISLNFIRKHADKINFRVDHTYYVYAGPTREYFSVPAKLSLSQRTDLPWSIELLEEFADRWNWSQLALNESIIWDEHLIDHFRDRIGFQSLCLRTDIPWTPELIDRYADKWNWQLLSGNSGLPWNRQLLKTYEDRWTWQNQVNYLKYLRGGSYTHLKPFSISHNSGIRWDTGLKEFIEKVDIWNVAACAYMSQPFIGLVHKQLSESRVIYTYWKRYSDYPLEEEEVKLSGWELIQNNEKRLYS